MRVRYEAVEEFAGAHHAVFLGGAREGAAIALQGTLFHTGQHQLAVFGQNVEIVDQIDQQEFFGQGFGEGRFLAELELPSTQREVAVALMVVDDGLVIELRRPYT